MYKIVSLVEYAKDEKNMSAKNKKFDRGSLSSGSSENLSAKRPGSAKVNRPNSADGSKYSARSTASLVSFVICQ